MPLTVWRIAALSAVVLVSCGGPSNVERTFAVAFIVESDPGVRLSHTRVFIDGEAAGESDSNGRVDAQISRRSGQRLRISYECPGEHEAPSEPKIIRLRKLEGTDDLPPRTMEITLRCRPLKRLIAFVVRAKNGSDLPILLDGENVARTDGSGVAHFSARGAPGTEYAVELDTVERPRLLPRSPTHLFTIADADEIFVIDQAFDLEKEPRPRSRRRRRITKIE